MAPIIAAVFPLTNKDGLPELAEKLEWTLRQGGIAVDFDDSGSIGRRYARQDEVGTPFCITVDNESLTDQKVTVRSRDTGTQERVAMSGLAGWIWTHLR